MSYYLSACAGKFGFKSFDLANQVSKGKKGSRKTKHGGVNVYKCGHCHLWHIGRKT